MTYKYITKVMDESFYDELNEILGNTKDTLAWFPSYMRDCCFAVLTTNDTNTHWQIHGYETLKIAPDRQQIETILDNKCFLLRVNIVIKQTNKPI